MRRSLLLCALAGTSLAWMPRGTPPQGRVHLGLGDPLALPLTYPNVREVVEGCGSFPPGVVPVQPLGDGLHYDVDADGLEP